MKGWAALICAYWLVLWFAVSTFGWRIPNYGPQAMMLGTAHRPFVTRALVPALMRPAVALGLPVDTAAVLFNALALAGFVAAARWLARGLGAEFSPGRLAVLVFGIMPLTLKQTHLYDLPTLALFTATLGAMAHRRAALFVLLFVLATINRETSLLIVVVYVAMHGLTHGALALGALWAIIRVGLMQLYAGQPGAAFEVHLAEHLPAMAGRIDVVVLYAMLGALLLWAVGRGWAGKPPLLQRAALIITPIIALLYVLVGFPFELRVFHETYPALGLLALWPQNGANRKAHDERGEGHGSFGMPPLEG